jgi:hypothetical protein|tara:strand:- start:886 stop:1248 length:363 start_codon:yes stop_codon:yes gene_type:complete
MRKFWIVFIILIWIVPFTANANHSRSGHSGPTPDIFKRCAELDIKVIENYHINAGKEILQTREKNAAGLDVLFWKITAKGWSMMNEDYMNLTASHDCWQKVAINLFKVLDMIYQDRNHQR